MIADVCTATAPSGNTVHYGRNARGNHIVSSRLIEDADFWFHAGGGTPGAHVLLKGDVTRVTKEDKAFCKRMAIAHSRCKSGACGISEARGHQVSVRPVGPLGTVVVTKA